MIMTSLDWVRGCSDSRTSKEHSRPTPLKHLLAALTPEKMAHLSAGEAYVWSSKATDEAFSKEAVKMHCRPRVTRHGGTTKTAVSHE
jgi:hypothetical protein